VNVIGSYVIGFFTGLTGPDGPLLVSPVARAFVTIGIIGGFTTFSSFSLQTMLLVQDGQWFAAAGNVLSSVALCLLAVAGGIALANALPRGT
jgi:fluoride exporter